MPLYPFQEQVYELLSVGRSVILQAPTGAGKTRAALYPFLRAWEYGEDFPRKCIYSVPLRVLASQFSEEYTTRAANFDFQRPLTVGIQTGAQPEDRKFEDNLIFTTVDQTLSNVLTIPYALSLGQGNLNAGAVLASYLVFDELHLFDPEKMLPTVLHFLNMVKGITPFLVMTATFSETYVQALAKMLGAEALVVSPEEAAAIPSQHKERRLHTTDTLLEAQAVLQQHRQRSVAICNTVARAQALFEALRAQAAPGTEVRLLHSRFLPPDRQAHENWLRREFGKEKASYTVESAILVATQVIEVGLDITCEALHTELAPAASVIQRAGRCARYQGEQGEVYVYPLPPDQWGKPSYAPYLKAQREICDRTWAALAARSGTHFDFGAELAVVNAAHAEADGQILAQLRAQRHARADKIAHTIQQQERGAARELIREVDSRTVIVHPDPHSIQHPWAYEGFGLYRGSLFGAYNGLCELQVQLNLPWAMMRAEPETEDDESSRAPQRWRWQPIESKDELQGALLVVVNPQLARYSAETGFQLGQPSAVDWQSPFRQRPGQRRDFAPYQRETFQEHVTRMWQVFEHPFYNRHAGKQRLALWEELAYAATRLERQQGWPAGTLERLARLVIALHDVGKLDVRWQAWAHQWQEKVGALRGEDLAIPAEYLAAHTDYNQQNGAENALSRTLQHLKPNHAVESAQAVLDYVWEQTKNEALTRAALTAITRHHSAGASGQHGEFTAHPAAPAALAEILAERDLRTLKPAFPAGTLSRNLIRPSREEELWPYLLLVRVLRLADQRSQELPA